MSLAALFSYVRTFDRRKNSKGFPAPCARKDVIEQDENVREERKCLPPKCREYIRCAQLVV